MGGSGRVRRDDVRDLVGAGLDRARAVLAVQADGDQRDVVLGPAVDQPFEHLVEQLLERQVGQVVDLRLKSGEKIGGKLDKVGDKLVLLSQLTGADFFDAVVDVDSIAAVAVRAKK